ncbi:MAG: RNA polymerase sigma factor [Bacteroidales bacterium]
MTEDQLVKKIKHKDREAFRMLVEQYQVRIRNTCFGFVRNKEDAEDVAQEVFIEVYRSIHKFREDAKLSTWIYRIAVNKSLNFIRSKKRSIWGHLFQNRKLENSAEVPEEIITEEAGPLEKMEKEEDLQLLQESLEALPENQKIAYVLHKIEELPYKEIANVMDVSLSSVESLIFRANKNMKSRLFKKMQKK